MRRIDKRPEPPPSFIAWKEKACRDWQPTFDAMPSNVKKDLKDALTAEQLGICCYCETKLTDGYSHIEHFRPRKSYGDLALDYQNMLCSCQANLKKGEPRHCGNAKADWFDESLLVSPLDRNCAAHFRHTGDGHIYPADEHDDAAQETIRHLALDIAQLVARRKEVLNGFLDENITDADFISFHERYFASLSADNPPEFISAITDVFATREKPSHEDPDGEIHQGQDRTMA